MDAHRKNDILLLADEKFDFDLSLSSSSANEDDEVFFGPVGHKERCIATGLELNNQIPEEPRLPASWSPLTGEKFVEVYKEAHLLALQIESNSRNKAAKAPKPEEPWGQGMENFVLESQLKINLFKKENELKKSPNSLKRETYYLSASPLAGPLLSGSALLPASQPALRGPGTQAELSEAQQPLLCAGPCGAAAEKKTGSKLQPPRASSTGGKAVHLAAEKLGLKKTLLKPPGCAGNLARKPLSSGPAASTARGSGVSPATGKATVSGLVNIPAHSSRPLSESSKPSGLGPAVQRLPLQSGPVDASCKQTKAAAVPERTGVQPEEPTTALPQPQTPEHRAPRLNSSSSVSKSSQLNKLGSIRRRDSCLNSKMKVMPTPTNQFKIPKFSVGESPDNATPKLSRAQRPQSCCSVERVVHSTPVRRPSGPAPPNFLSSAGTPMSTKRGSALPTPASRRLSGLPFMTPNTRPRALGSPLGMPARRLSSEPRKKSAVRTEPTKESNTNVVSRQSDLPSVPSISPPSVVPQALNFSPEKSDFLFLKTITTEATLNEAKATEETSPNEALLVDIKLDQLTIAPEAGGAPHVDFPLIDLCSTPEATGEQLLLKPSVAWGSESKPLIDLMINTPDINKNVASKPFQEVGQLIDLGSPLIQLSPEADKENVDSPLLKF
ncbi:G2 and S phase-expressed protein 1 isoform X2 [Dasypus novemcinctus]|uniref:G2 and S phase-expressed protein 1 isoform X2 n=1 Tax=Dasypus novemcinctus TaxID=9361 RepID=UPI00265D7B0B|nr:G2 and S phase-expressed protein 1 isoform X2 [Dasypus novemcinctus]XP_058164925.1 G2 and S phase-expressed protein 1 isoform X2 [Dasypus novemcinctus]